VIHSSLSSQAIQRSEYNHSTLHTGLTKSTVKLLNMRFLAVLPILLSVPAIVLTFLVLFAGSQENFMEDYAVLTVRLFTSSLRKDRSTDSDSSTHRKSATISST